MLRDNDLSGGDEASGCGASWLHEAFPVAASFCATYGLGGLGRTDGFGFVSG
jgi:hypothetical protein